MKNFIVNPTIPYLVEEAIKNGEGKLNDTGALVVKTGKYTGRSPKDKFIVDNAYSHDKIAWGSVNVPISEEKFTNLKNKIIKYLEDLEKVYVFKGFAGADKNYAKSFTVYNELASENLFIQQLLIKPTLLELDNFVTQYQVYVAPGFKCIPEVDGTNSEAAIIINYETKEIVIAGSQYAGEIKKSVFSTMNFILPENNVLPMHCSANMDENGETAVFFGLSGTGKTTLSADPNRILIGDDEHGWSDDGVFNIEGGCYAKCIGLKEENEPEIYNAIKFGSLVENVIMDKHTRKLLYDDDSLTENTRVGYPIEFIPNATLEGKGKIPKTIIFLTADAFGVLPPISKLTKEQAMYYFMSGYTSKLAGTERGITEPQATFSACFGEPFLPREVELYAKMLGEKIEKYNTNVYLVNTGWVGGPYGVGNRMKLSYTRAMVSAAINGHLDESKVKFVKDDTFNLAIPTACPNVPSDVMLPRDMWENKEDYDKQAKMLAEKFNKNFTKYANVSEEIKKAGPTV